MQAEVFAVTKSSKVYGQRHFTLKGKDYDNALAKMPYYTQKIAQIRLKIDQLIPPDEANARNAYASLKEQLLARDSNHSYVPDADKEFEEKMLIMQYSKVLEINDVGKTFGFVYELDPYDLLDQVYQSYHHSVHRTVSNLFVLDNVRRRKKLVSLTHDYCQDLAKSLNNDPGWKYGGAKNAYDLVYKCYDSFPFSQDSANKIFDLVKFMTEFYVFTNFTSNGSGAGNFINSIREQELEFDSNLRFFTFLSRTMNQINDAHISITNECYEKFTFIQPINVQIIAESHSMAAAERLVITKASIASLKEWEGYEIVYIDGIGSYYGLYRYMNSIGRSHEPRTRLVFGVSKMVWDSSTQDFRLERGMFFKRNEVPDRAFVVYTLKEPGGKYLYQVKVDWMVYKSSTLRSFNNQYSYWKDYCEAKPFTKKLKTAPTPTEKLYKRQTTGQEILSTSKADKAKFKKGIIRRSELNNDETLKPTCEGVTPIAVGPGFAFFILEDPVEGKYGVLMVQSFDIIEYENWFMNMRKGFKKLIAEGITRLLLDLSSNYGGVLCLAYSLISVLSPHPTLPFPATNYTFGTRAIPNDSLMKFSKCVDEAGIKGSPFKIQSFNNLTCRCDFADQVIWSTGGEVKPKVVAGFASGYSMFSPFLIDKCSMKYFPYLIDVKPKFESIIVLTDGTCGSSCAIVALYFHQNGFPGIITYTPMTNGCGWLLPNIYSFAGGQVISSENIKDVAKRSSCYDLVPKTTERIQVTMTYRGIFNEKDDRFPMEFYVSPATTALRFTANFSNSVSNRWIDSFQLGMDVIRNPQKYVVNLSDFVLVGGLTR